MSESKAQQILDDILIAERIVAAIAEFTGLDHVTLFKVAKTALPELYPAPPDEAADYFSAEQAARAKTDPAPPPEAA